MIPFFIAFAVVGLIGALGAVNNLQHSEAPANVSDEPHHNAIFYRCCAVHMSVVTFLALASLAGVLHVQPWGFGTCVLFSLHACGSAYLISRAVINGVKSKRLARFKLTGNALTLHPVIRVR